MSLPGIRQKPRVGAFVCLRPQGRAGDLFVIKKAMNLGLGFVCGGCDPRRMAQAQAGACLQLRPQGRAATLDVFNTAILPAGPDVCGYCAGMLSAARRIRSARCRSAPRSCSASAGVKPPVPPLPSIPFSLL